VAVAERVPTGRDRAGNRRAPGGTGNYPENPWAGIHAGRQLLFDLRHPLLFGRRAAAGLRGEIPHISQEQCLLGVALMAVGGVDLLADIAMVVHGAGGL
jgi:hypothetical protein